MGAILKYYQSNCPSSCPHSCLYSCPSSCLFKYLSTVSSVATKLLLNMIDLLLIDDRELHVGSIIAGYNHRSFALELGVNICHV